ncbi:hypothetical protein BJX66DRAFT_320097, partial [Aspergillus keveii]
NRRALTNWMSAVGVSRSVGCTGEPRAYTVHGRACSRHPFSKHLAELKQT